MIFVVTLISDFFFLATIALLEHLVSWNVWLFIKYGAQGLY